MANAARRHVQRASLDPMENVRPAAPIATSAVMPPLAQSVRMRSTSMRMPARRDAQAATLELASMRMGEVDSVRLSPNRAIQTVGNLVETVTRMVCMTRARPRWSIIYLIARERQVMSHITNTHVQVRQYTLETGVLWRTWTACLAMKPKGSL